MLALLYGDIIDTCDLLELHKCIGNTLDNNMDIDGMKYIHVLIRTCSPLHSYDGQGNASIM